MLEGECSAVACARGFPLCLTKLTIPHSWRALIIEKVFSPLRLSFSLSVLTRLRAGRVGAQRLRVAWVYPNEYSADAWSARRGTPAAFAHIGKALNLQYVILSLDAKSILVLRHNSILVLRRHSILRRQGGVKEKGTSPTCLFKAKSDTKVELAKLTTLCVALLGTLSQRQLLF